MKKDITIDAKDKILGRLATRAAVLLRGKDEPEYLPYKFLPKKVIVFNTDKIRVTGQKLEDKIYYRHSGYPGGIKKESLGQAMTKDSRRVVRRAVYGMLPKNKLQAKFIQNLELHRGELK